MLKVFVYGTLKPGETNYQYYCADQLVEAMRAYTYGQLYDLPIRGYPAMLEGKDRVEGFLLSFADQAVLTKLDELEDYQAGRSPEENEYYRQLIMVYNPSGEPLGEAWCYFMTLAKIKELEGILEPSGWWSKSPK